MSILKGNGCCFNCLNRGHVSEQCPLSKRCWKCQLPHHTWLHNEQKSDSRKAMKEPSKNFMSHILRTWLVLNSKYFLRHAIYVLFPQTVIPLKKGLVGLPVIDICFYQNDWHSMSNCPVLGALSRSVESEELTLSWLTSGSCALALPTQATKHTNCQWKW